MEKITLFVSVKNREETIEKCIRSLIGVEWPQKKILIVDNMSTDRTYEILKKFGSQIELRRVEGNLSEVFNWALSCIDTKYVLVTDSDCVVDKNWAKELLLPFEKDLGIVATAGFCGTPKDVSLLQKLIGIELEQRFKNFPEFISRAPTMNLCLKTDVARAVGFDKDFVFQAFEADFGYRLTKYGKIEYNPKALVWHYHRSTLLGFFMQQKDYARWAVSLIYKHKIRALADHITTFDMFLQLFVFFLLLFSVCLILINFSFYYPFFFCLLILLVLYFQNIFKINPGLNYYPAVFGLFLLRTIAWAIGVFEGVLKTGIQLSARILRG